jgi:branched-chain amino acid transport system substrate-binding protein
MSQKNDTPAVILALLVTIALLGGGAWWLFNQFNPATFGNGSSGNPSISSGGSPAPFSQERLSLGERVLVTEGASPEKQTGVQAIANGDFAGAIVNLEAALKANSNDPEALIYLNNARIANQKNYTIAVAVPVATSVNPALEILRGVAQAQTEINQAGGVNGVPIKVMVVSDDNAPETVEQVAAALVANSSVMGVIGHFGSEATLAGAPIYQQGNLVMISPTSTTTALSEFGDFVFRTVPSDRFTASTLSRYMLNTLQKQNAVVYFNSESAYSNSLKDEFSTALATDGGRILTQFDLSSPNFDAAGTLEQANQQGAEVLVLLANTSTLDPTLQVIAVNRGELDLLGGDSLYNPKTLQVGGAAVEGMVVAVPWILLSNPNTPFVKSSRALWGGDVNWRTATAYDAAQVLIAGLRQGGDRAAVKNALNDANFSIEGATGTIRFLPSGDRNQPMQLVTVQPGDRSGYGYDFVPAP